MGARILFWRCAGYKTCEIIWCHPSCMKCNALIIMPARRFNARWCPAALFSRDASATALASPDSTMMAATLRLDMAPPARPVPPAPSSGAGSSSVVAGPATTSTPPYECAECKYRFHRAEFLIEARDMQNSLAPALDWQGHLHGRCYECCRGRGPHRTRDLYNPSLPEDVVKTQHKKECRKRHSERHDVKARDCQRLRALTFKDMIKVAQAAYPAESNTKRRKRVLEVLRDMRDEMLESFRREAPWLAPEMARIMKRYRRMKEHEAQHPDWVADIKKDLATVGQMGDAVAPQVHRYFVCRFKDCSPRGHYFGLNSHWVSTHMAGGWQFVCPVCCRRYAPWKQGEHLLKANHVWVLETSGRLLLSEWPATAEESCINAMVWATAERDGVNISALSEEDLLVAIKLKVEKFGIPLLFEDMEFTEKAAAQIEAMNATRVGKVWDTSGVKDGFKGSFIKPCSDSLIMSYEDTKELLALLCMSLTASNM